MLYGLTKFKTELDRMFEKINENPNAELEFRLGTYLSGRFQSGSDRALALLSKLETDLVIFKRTRYTSIMFPDGVRMRDGEAQKKTQIYRVDLDYAPIAMRMSLAEETSVARPAPDAIPTSTREIERWSAILPKFSGVELSVSEINNTVWEIELEFKTHPRNIDDAFHPLQYVLGILLADRPNMVPQSVIPEITEMYCSDWKDAPQAGFVRRIGYRPLNFIKTDMKRVKTSKYAVSNKLDGAKYTMICHSGSVFAVSEVDAIWLGSSEKCVEKMYFDGEWDPVEHVLHIFDYITRSDQGLEDRLTIARGVVKSLAVKSVVMKHVLVSGKTAVDTRSIISWMKKKYGNKWTDRNDGIIFTPIDVPYLAGKDRALRTLKYKLPDKISVDVRLRNLKISDEEKIYSAFAMGTHGETEVRQLRVTLNTDDAYFNVPMDGVIAEIGLRDGAFYIMRIRSDKTQPNFITVVLETINDMRNPIQLDALVRGLRLNGVTGGATNDVLSTVTDDQRTRAAKYIKQDRESFWPVYKTILQFAEANGLKLSNPECLTTRDVAPTIIKLYTSTALKSANDLANKLFEQCSDIVFMKTVIPYEEFDISVLNRNVVKFLNYPRVKHIRTDRLFSSCALKIKEFDLETMDPEIELIEVYHKLYMPFPEYWEDARTIEEKLAELTRTRFEHVVGAGHDERNEFTRVVRKAIHDGMEFNDLGVLVGHWGYYELFPKSDPHNEKVQIISDIDPDAMREKLEMMLRDVTPMKLTYKTEELYIPYDPHVRRTTFYFSFKGSRVPLVDVFNSTTYEMIPYVTFGGKRIRVGNPFVLSRFFLIDRWILMVLQHGGFVLPDVAQKKSKVLIDKVLKLRTKSDMAFGDEYDGVYKDFAIERRRLLRQEEKFRPYKPLEYLNQHGVLRVI